MKIVDEEEAGVEEEAKASVCFRNFLAILAKFIGTQDAWDPRKGGKRK